MWGNQISKERKESEGRDETDGLACICYRLSHFFISAPKYLVLPMRSQDVQSMALIQVAQGRPRQAVAMAASAAPHLLSPFLFLRKKTMY